MKLFVFRVLMALISVAIIFVGLEVGLNFLFKEKKIMVFTDEELFVFTKYRVLENKTKKLPPPVYIPHPYFGFVYTPNNSFSQAGFTMHSNSEGFLDIDFPANKKKGECLYGLLGGSAAMSWGVHEREERISYQLEHFLNKGAVNSTCKKYRVLNLGLGGAIQYQATMIFLYYQSILDGVVFYYGNNECSHPSMLKKHHDPIPYPNISFDSITQVVSPFPIIINEKKEKLAKDVKGFLDSSYKERILYRYYFSIKVVQDLKKISKMSSLHSEVSRGLIPPSFRIKEKKLDELRKLFPKLTDMEFWYGKNEFAQKTLIGRYLPSILTVPLQTAFAVAKTNKIHFLSVIQPMSGGLAKYPEWDDPKYAIPLYQKSCLEQIKKEAEGMKKFGIDTLDLNARNVFNSASADIFLDGTHLNSEGNKIVANKLFQLISDKWRKN